MTGDALVHLPLLRRTEQVGMETAHLRAVDGHRPQAYREVHGTIQHMGEVTDCGSGADA